MRKIFLKVAISAICGLMAFAPANAEVPISFSGQIGYASPQGGFFKNADGEKMSTFGIGLDFDVLWHFEQFDNKLSAGITWNTSFLFGADLDGGFDIGLFGLDLYGVKGQWRFFDGKVSPYGGLSLGLSRLSTPEITMTDGSGKETVIAESESAFSFGIRPEIGFDLGGFLISVAYFVPMKYSFDGAKSESAGNLQVNIGYRHILFDR